MGQWPIILIACILTFADSSWGQKLELISSEHGVPWGMVFLDENNILFTERQGSFKVLDLTVKTTQKVMPKIEAKQGGQAGLLDVALDPGFSKNHKIYFTYSKPVNQKHTTALATAELKRDPKKGWQLSKIKDLFLPNPMATMEFIMVAVLS